MEECRPDGFVLTITLVRWIEDGTNAWLGDDRAKAAATIAMGKDDLDMALLLCFVWYECEFFDSFQDRKAIL
jgi:hypothetical protein